MSPRGGSPAGVAQGTFYSYVDSKEAAFTEVAQQVVETMMADDAVSASPGRRRRTAPDR
jgi:AcrR family transcriptional regulator